MDNIIIKYLQGEATEKEKEELLGWLRESSSNKKTFSQLRDIWLSSEVAEVSKPAYVQAAYRRFLESVRKEEKLRKQKHVRLYLKIAASVAILLICSLGSYWAGNNRGFYTDRLEAVVMNQVIMGKDSKGPVVLPDGTVVWLNADSRLIYPEKFSSGSRSVKLEGEGYFKVARNEKAPFYVETDGMTVQVLGTSFDVKNYKGKRVSETTLLSGKVEVSLPGESEKIGLYPNQKILWNKENGSFEVDEVDAQDYIIWINEKLVFTNEKLSEILKKMEYWYGVKIDCQKGVLLDQRLSLTVRKESKEEIFKLLSLIAPISYNIDNDRITVRKK